MRRIKSAAAAITALVLLASCGDYEPSAPTGEASAMSASDSDYTALPKKGADRLRAGLWALRNPDGSAPLAVLKLPYGFGGGEGVLFFHGDSAIGYSLVDRIYKDPCSASPSAARIGASVEDLAAALTAQQVTTTTKPVPVLVDGHAGLYVELTAPADFDYDACNKGVLFIWDTPAIPAGARYIDGTGTDRYWILNVDGQRVVLLTWVPAGADEETVELLSRIVEGATFVDED